MWVVMFSEFCQLYSLRSISKGYFLDSIKFIKTSTIWNCLKNNKKFVIIININDVQI